MLILLNQTWEFYKILSGVGLRIKFGILKSISKMTFPFVMFPFYV
jgi:hypothetical protein